LPDCPIARLPDCPIARLPDCPIARLPLAVGVILLKKADFMRIGYIMPEIEKNYKGEKG
jgi:hypothetical protein